MTIEFQLTEKDYIRAYRRMFIKSLIGISPIMIIILLFFSIVEFYNQNKGIVGFFNILICISITVAVIAVFYFLYYKYQSFKVLKQIKNNANIDAQTKISIENEGLLVEKEYRQVMISWRSILNCYGIEEYVVVLLYDNKFVLIPDNCFKNIFDKADFMGVVINHLTIEKKTRKGIFNSSIFNKKDKSLYVWSFILLVLIFTFVINGNGSKSDQKKETLKNVKNQLNTIIKEVEYFKITNGVYPDSLMQLVVINGPQQPIIDQFNFPKQFFYYKKDQEYTLFSVGPDKIKYTKDDIFPNVSMDSNSTIGWRNPKKFKID